MDRADNTSLEKVSHLVAITETEAVGLRFMNWFNHTQNDIAYSLLYPISTCSSMCDDDNVRVI